MGEFVGFYTIEQLAEVTGARPAGDVGFYTVGEMAEIDARNLLPAGRCQR